MHSIIDDEGLDKLPVTQAQAEGLIVVTNDEKISRYGIRVMDAKS